MKRWMLALGAAFLLVGGILGLWYALFPVRGREAMRGGSPPVRPEEVDRSSGKDPRSAGTEAGRPVPIPQAGSLTARRASLPSSGDSGVGRAREAGEEAGDGELRHGEGEILFDLKDPAGKPFTRATVTLLCGRASRAVPADREGLAIFSGIAPSTYSFTVAAEGLPELAAAREIVLSPDERKRVSLTLGAFELAIAGRVLERSGAPVNGILVRARRQIFDAREGELVRSDQTALESLSGSDGNYEIPGIDAADYVLTTEATEVYPSVTRVYRGGVQSADLVLDAGRLLEVHGTVTSRAGAVIGGVRIASLGQTARRAETDAGGRFRLELETSDEPSVHVLTAAKEGFREARVNIHGEEVGMAETWQVDIVLDPLGERAPVTGRMSDPDQNPVSGETVYLHSTSLSARHQATSDDDGRFSLGDVQVGEDYRLWIYPRRAFRDYSRSPVSIVAPGVELECVLEPLEEGALSGVMVDPRGVPVPGFTLWLRSLKALGKSIAVTGDASGAFEASGVPGGELLFETRSAPRFTVRGIQCSPPADTVARLTLDWGKNALAGSVVDEHGGPVTGANVSLYWSMSSDGVQSSSFRSSVTDAAGRFSFSELAHGEHKLSVSSSTHTPAQETYDVGGEASAPVLRVRSKIAGPGK